MRPITSIRPVFVDAIPKVLEDGVLYVSETYGTASHKCACGCGMRVVTPLIRTDWRVVREMDGSVSVFPSIGNWDYPCESHYWIRRNQIEWARKWSAAEIRAGRELDRAQRAAYFRQKVPTWRNWLESTIARIKRLLK